MQTQTQATSEGDPFTPRMLRDALGTYPTGVAIVTAVDALGTPVGLTINSFSSVSLEPPLVLWSLARTSRSFEVFRDAQHWAVHILAADQQSLSQRFSRPAEDRFAGLDWSAGQGGAPLIEGCAARLQCRIRSMHEGGDHVIFVGEVLHLSRHSRPPLAYHAGRYAAVQSFEHEAQPA